MSNKSFYISLILFVLTITSVSLISRRGEPVVVSTNLENLPMEIAGSKATEDFFSDSVYEELNADMHVYRRYRFPDGKMVDLYIGYYGTAKGGRTPHNPHACLPGEGWAIIDTHKVKLTYYPNTVEVNYILAKKQVSYGVVFHWYQSDRDKILARGIQQNVQRFLGRIANNSNDGAFVRVSAFTDQVHIEETKKLVGCFSQKLLTLLPHYWPVEK